MDNILLWIQVIHNYMFLYFSYIVVITGFISVTMVIVN